MTNTAQTVTEAQQQIVASFQRLSDWDERYQKIIELGRALPPYPEAFRVETFQVKGCQSQVWLHPVLQGEAGTIAFDADSDALLVKGLIALLMKVYNHRTPDEILATEPSFLDDIQLVQNLSMQRNNGLAAMLKQIKLYAYAFKMQASMG